MTEQVILVDTADNAIGRSEKLAAHRGNLLHRAFSVLIFNDAGDMLLQQRSRGKYHSPGLWSNACCGHPRPEEATMAAAKRRLKEEMGFDCPLTFIANVRYQCRLDDGMFENEIVHVFLGLYNGAVHPDEAEVAAYVWATPGEIRRDIGRRAADYAIWFRKYAGEPWFDGRSDGA